jgi:adenine/guanine phosphoribosyltransferase-like PRPP-binding protein
MRSLIGLAVRRNPRRAHLLVSTVLGKYVPVGPDIALEAAESLADRVSQVVGDAGSGDLVVGYAETATALGHAVAAALALPYIHSTRTPGGVPSAIAFEEAHSHARQHELCPEDESLLRMAGTVVLVDDELTTGRTVLATIRALHTFSPHRAYVVAALVDVRSAEARAGFDDLVREIGVPVDVVALASGAVSLPDDVLERGAGIVASVDAGRHDGLDVTGAAGTGGRPPGEVVRVEASWPADVSLDGRHGIGAGDHIRIDTAVAALGAQVLAALPSERSPRVHVLGHEEFMYVPLRLAAQLQRCLSLGEVSYSSTARSPVVALDEPGYAIRSAVAFPAHDGPVAGPTARFVYNICPGQYDAIVLCLEPTADTVSTYAVGGVVDSLRRLVPLLLVVVPGAGDGSRPGLGSA